MATTVNNSAWLQWMTGVIGGGPRQTAAAAFPSDRFYCLLDELPLHLIPQQARHSLSRPEDREPLYLNPNCSLARGEQIPAELPSELLSGFALRGTIAWVRDSHAKSLLPFWVGPEIGKILRNLRPHEPVLSGISNSTKSLLAAAGILIRPDAEGATVRRRIIEKAASEFQQKGYAPLVKLMHPFHVAALRRYYRHQIRYGTIRLGDGQSPRRYCAHNEPVARFFHHQITATLSAVAGEPLKPSYVYLASYLSGAELKKHVDREQCEFSITFCLDFSPEPELATPWPISLDTPQGAVTVSQALGDGLAYRGTRLPHYRGFLGEGQTSTSIFFHYVREDFSGSLG